MACAGTATARPREREESVVREPHDRRAEDGREREVVLAPRDRPEEVERVHDLGRLEEPAATVHPVRDAALAQRALVERELGHGAEEDRAVAVLERLAEALLPERVRLLEELPLDDRRDPRRDRARLGDARHLERLAVGEDRLDRGSFLGEEGDRLGRPERLVRDLAPRLAEDLREDGVHVGEDRRPRPEARVERHDEPARPPHLVLDLEEPAHLGVPEAVDRLLHVAHGEECVRPPHEVHDLLLEPRGVLELVDQDRLEARAHLLADVRARLEELARPLLEVAEVERRELGLPCAIDGVEASDQVLERRSERARRALDVGPAEVVERRRHREPLVLEESVPAHRARGGLDREVRPRGEGLLLDAPEPLRLVHRVRELVTSRGARARVRRERGLVAPEGAGDLLLGARHARLVHLVETSRPSRPPGGPGRERARPRAGGAHGLVERVDAEVDPREALLVVSPADAVHDRVVGLGPLPAEVGLRRGERRPPHARLGELGQDRERRVHVRLDGERPQEAPAEAVDRRDPGALERVSPRGGRRALPPELAPDPVAHLARGLLGERDREDLARVDAVAHEPEVALDKDERLPGARARGDADRAATSADRLVLGLRSLLRHAAPPAARGLAAPRSLNRHTSRTSQRLQSLGSLG